jgi:hypothetical protein
MCANTAVFTEIDLMWDVIQYHAEQNPDSIDAEIVRNVHERYEKLVKESE